MVYEDAERLYAEVRKDVEKLIDEAIEALFPSPSRISSRPLKESPSGNIVALNTTFFPRRDIVKIPLASRSSLTSKVVQIDKDNGSGYALLDCSDGGHVSCCRGLYADCMPASGESLISLWNAYSPLTSLGSFHQWFGPLCPQEFQCPVDDLEWKNHKSLGCRT